MTVIFLILLFISASKADHSVEERCSNSSQSSLLFEPSKDGVEGRYAVEWCTKADNNVTKWELVLRYIESRAPKKCQTYKVGFPIGQSHSRLELPVTIDSNCSHVCLSTFLDLIFNGTCYHLRTLLRSNTGFSSSDDSLHYVINNYTKQHFTGSKAVVSVQSYEGGVELNWYLGFIPATDYSVYIWDKDTESSPAELRCQAGGSLLSEVRCVAQVPARCYTAHLTHRAPWIAAPSVFGHLANIEYVFCHSPGGVPVVPSDRWWGWREWWRVLCSVAGVLLLAGLLLWTLRKRLVAAWKRRVRDRWLADSSSSSSPVKAGPGEGVILLLYARDCVLLERAADALRSLLQAASGRQVLDLYSSSSVRLWARSGEDWLRLLVAREDTRVVLLQTPAGTLLSADLLHTRHGPTPGAPLLPSRALCRRPHPGDSLLPLALRLLVTAPPPTPYTRHYVSSISGVEADMAPAVTPLRRYVLPEATPVLLRDLAPAPAAHDAQLQRFTAALQQFTDYVRDNPDYLTDELIFK
ncbi:uncharacterized protein LOC116768439 [Danaus plexippus]|uniref:uncharacterized protein LOC116768439 n=1 Tax=Danaus plexippus TaxID=13037 RepID=UPI002AB10450|nr:uncharacterized protein LOC116768439 [Danaus plexippus]